MTDLLKDILDTLNSLPNRKVVGKDWTTYDLAKRVEQELDFRKWLNEENKAVIPTPFNIVEVGIVCKHDDVNYVTAELLDLQLGVYSFGTRILALSEAEYREVVNMVPEDVMTEYLKEELENERRFRIMGLCC